MHRILGLNAKQYGDMATDQNAAALTRRGNFFILMASPTGFEPMLPSAITHVPSPRR